MTVSVPCSGFVVVANTVFILKTQKAASSWGDSPVNKVISTECEELSSDPQHPHKKSGTVVHTSNPSIGKAATGRCSA